MSDEASIYRSDITAERAVLGSIIIDSDVWPVVAGILKATDYYSEKHARIHRAIEAMVKAGETLDLVTLPAAMGKNGAERDDLTSYIARMVDEVPTTVNAGRYARIVAECAQARRVVDEAKELQETIRGGANPDEIYKAAQRLARKAEPASKGSSVLTAPEMLDHLSRYHEVAAEARKKSVNGLIIETPWPDLNRLIGGFQGSRRPIYLVAQEKVGKSQVGLKALLHAAMRGVAALFFSLELPHIQVTPRLLGLLSGISPNRIQEWIKLTVDESPRVIDAWNYFQTLPFIVDGKVDRKAAGYKASPSATLAQMVAAYERLVDRGMEPGIIAIDYAQIMDADARDERQKYIEISEGLADWATSIPAPILVLAQCLSRENGKKERPSARDIFGSSNFAKTASTVIVCDRPPLRLSSDERGRLSPSELEEAALIVDIDEYGRTGKIDIRHDATNGNWLPLWGDAPAKSNVIEFAPRQDLPREEYELQGVTWEDDDK